MKFSLIAIALIYTFGALCSVIPEVPVFIPLDLTNSELEHLVGDPQITHKVRFEISKKVLKDFDEVVTTKLGVLTLGLFGYDAPRTTKNFIHLAENTYEYGYIGSPFHRIIHNFMVQGGDFQNRDGTGGYSIYNKGKFDDEPISVKHDKQGRLSMANSGKNTNGAQFFITTQEKCDWLDGKHVVFGQLLDGFDILLQMNNVEVNAQSKPSDEIFISNAQVLYFKIEPNMDGYFRNTKIASMEEINEEGIINYNYLFVFILIAALGLLFSQRYYRNQLIMDIRHNKDYY